MSKGALFFAALAALGLAAGAHAAPRVLLEADDAEVRMESELRCGGDAAIVVLARDPKLLSGDSARLQAIVDATRAMLGFECRNLAGIVVSGRLAGLREDSYQAIAGPESDWRLQASRTVKVSALDAPAAWPEQSGEPAGSGGYAEWSPPASQPAAGADYAVRELHRGMRVDEALVAVRRGFSAEPNYDRERELLSVVEGGCPVAGEVLSRDFWPRAGDTCLEAGFDGERLQRLVFGQVVDTDQSTAIRSALLQRYGNPALETQPSSASMRLGWGRALPGQTKRHELEAQIDVREGVTILVIQLAGGEEAPRFQADF